ncbi:MAG: hypothetical protein FWH42_06315, partial [Dehalococcoidia bacterium]|nr:hypothetical protein [Dehalococcoidia bacterium]
MKKAFSALLGLSLIGFCACVPTTPDETTSVESDPYSDVCKTYFEMYDGDLDGLYYNLYDIDGNGTQEFLRGWDTTYSGIVIDAIFTIQNGVAVRQEALPPWMEESDVQRWLFGNGIIKCESSSESIES